MSSIQENSYNWLWMIYEIGVVGMALRFAAKIVVLVGYIRSARQIRYQQAALILHQKEIAPFSFLHYIFLNQDQYHQNQIHDMILTHELAHVNQKHTCDILTMMNKTKKPTTMMTKQILLLPMLAGMIWSFGQSKTIYSKEILDRSPSPGQIVQEDSNQLIIEYEYDFFGGMMAYTLDPKGSTYPRGQAPGEPIQYILAAIRDDLKVSFLTAQNEEVVKICRDLTRAERERFWNLDESKATYFHRSPKVNRPSEEEWKAFQNPKEYGIWLDGVRIENAELTRYRPQDIHSYGKSRLMKNAANYGKHTFQLNLYSQAAFDQDYKEKETGYWIPVRLNGMMAY